MKTSTKDFVTLRTRKRASGLEALYLDIFCDGQRKTEYLKLYLTGGRSREDKARDKETMRQAEVMRAQRVLELQNRRMGMPEYNPRSVRFYPYFDKIMATKTEGNRNIWKCTKIMLMKYHPDENLRFSEITPRWVRGFCEYLDKVVACCNRDNYKITSERKLTESTKDMYYTKFKELLEFAVRDEIIPRNPAKGVRHYKPNPSPKEFLTVEELRCISATAVKYEVVKRMFLFSCLTGLRWSDVASLKWENIHFKDDRAWLSIIQKKTKGAVTVYLDKQALILIGKPGAPEKKVFSDSLDRRTTQYNLTKWMKDAGIEKHITFHCARHTFATVMLSRGVDIYTVSKLLGHGSIKTTQIYLRLLDENRIKAVKMVPQIL